MRRQTVPVAGAVIGFALGFAELCLGDPTPARNAVAPAIDFTLPEAELFAQKNNPRIASANATADAVRQQIREARSNFFPQIYGEIDAVDAPQGTRLSALSGLNNPAIYSRESDGVVINQLLTDFGKTYELTDSARARSQAADQRARAMEQLVRLEVDRTYFELLRAQAVLQVGRQTVASRQLVFDRIDVLMKSKLKSELDASFAQVNLDQGKLLVVQGESGLGEAQAAFAAALGFHNAMNFNLREEPVIREISPSDDLLVEQALNQRPDILALGREVEADHRLAQAAVSAEMPKISILAAGAINPLYDARGLQHDDYAAGLNVEIPISTGGNLDARRREARATETAAEQTLINAENLLSRDVRSAWLNEKTDLERMNITELLIQNAVLSEHLAEARYRLGISSIVELSQAQLNLTEAQLQQAGARYDYQIARALISFTTGQPN